VSRVVQISDELRRILALPRRPQEHSQELAAELTRCLRRPGGTQTFRPIQATALHEIWAHRGLLGPIGVGEGKTLVTLLAPVVLGSLAPVLILPAKLLEKTRREMVELNRHWKIPNHLRMYSYETMGRADHVHLLRRHPLCDTLIADECFSGDTIVQTPHGPRPIDSIEVGDLVFSWDGRLSVQRVLNVMRKPARVLDIVCGSHKITCTANHPFLTTRGWVAAGELSTDDSVCVVRSRARVQSEKESLLFSEMLGNLAHGATRDPGEGLHSGDGGEDLGRATSSLGHDRLERAPLGSDEGAQPDAERGDAREGLGHAQGDRTPTEGAGRERETSLGSALGAFDGIESLSWRLLDPGLLDLYGMGWRTPLLDRLREAGLADRDRGGRGESRDARASGVGREEGHIPSIARLVRVSDVQYRSTRGCEVFNLEVSGPHTYLVGPGIVVHNCHKLRNPKAAVSRRVKRFFDEFPDVPFIGLSGSICKRSIRDYAHLLRWALKTGSPLPEHFGELEDWADALDEHDRERPEPGALVLLGAEDDSLTAVRRAYQRRLTETPGVVSSIRNRIGASLLIRGVRYPQGPAIAEAFAGLRSRWELPDGTELVDGMEFWRHARELALGFFMRWDPAPPDWWLEPRKAWSKRLREILGYSRTLDSELHLVRAIDSGAHRESAPVLAAWREVRDTFTPNPVPVWIDDGPLEFAAAWAASHQGIVWTEHVPFAKELAKRTKLTYYGRRGEDSEGRLLDQHVGPCIASRQSGAEGFNLQRWNEALVTAVVANGIQTEQLLGRLHRPGQESDVTFDLMIGCREHLDSFWKAHADALFERDTMGTEGKILYADIDMIDVTDSAPQWARRQ
jgi:hypothetical protein